MCIYDYHIMIYSNDMALYHVLTLSRLVTLFYGVFFQPTSRRVCGIEKHFFNILKQILLWYMKEYIIMDNWFHEYFNFFIISWGNISSLLVVVSGVMNKWRNGHNHPVLRKNKMFIFTINIIKNARIYYRYFHNNYAFTND